MSENTTLDAFLSGGLKLRQARAGHRSGIDAILLASVTPPGTDGLILDVGAGSGAVGLAAAVHAPSSRVGLIECDPLACALSRENIAFNQFDARARVFELDLASGLDRRKSGLIDESAQLILTNPPFYERGRVRITPDSAKANAHIASMPLSEWTRHCLALLAPGGFFSMIHRAEALGECLAAVSGRLGAVRILTVFSRPSEPAIRIILGGVKGSKAPMSLRPALALQDANGAVSDIARKLGGGALLQDLVGPFF
ncbi:MAG: tRNA1(Val) (adenine(37)-N6)-methyltransferase [Methylocystis sp.]